VNRVVEFIPTKVKVSSGAGIHEVLSGGFFGARNVSSRHCHLSLMRNSNSGNPLSDGRLGAPSIVHGRDRGKGGDVEGDVSTVGHITLELPWSRRSHGKGEAKLADIGFVGWNVEEEFGVDLMTTLLGLDQTRVLSAFGNSGLVLHDRDNEMGKDTAKEGVGASHNSKSKEDWNEDGGVHIVCCRRVLSLMGLLDTLIVGEEWA
jgi:hypothetical protein